jgi:hypothetical protein
MGGDLALPEVEADQVLAGVQLQGFADVLVGNGVVVALVLDVVVDVDLDRLDLDEAVGVARQRPEGGFVQLFEGLAAVAWQLFEGLVVEFLEQRADTLIQLSQCEEAVVAKTGEDPALDELYPDLGLGLVPGLVGPRRHHGELVMLGELLVAGVELRIVAAGFGDPAFQIIRNDDGGGAAKVLEGPDVAREPIGQ